MVYFSICERINSHLHSSPVGSDRLFAIRQTLNPNQDGSSSCPPKHGSSWQCRNKNKHPFFYILHSSSVSCCNSATSRAGWTCPHQMESLSEMFTPFSSYRFSMIRLASLSWAEPKLETTRHGMPRARDTGGETRVTDPAQALLSSKSHHHIKDETEQMSPEIRV